MYEGGLSNLSWLNPQATAKMAVDNKPVTAGIKIQLSKPITGSNDLECLKRALQAAEIAHMPLDGAHRRFFFAAAGYFETCCARATSSRTATTTARTAFWTRTEKLFRKRGTRASAALFSIRRRGKPISVSMWPKNAWRRDFLPETISTDLTIVTVERRVFDLPTMVSKFMAIGVPLDKAIAMVTVNPTRVFDFGAQIGTLRPGSEADVSIYELRDGKFEFEDSDGMKRTGQKMLASKAVVRRGQLFINFDLARELGNRCRAMIVAPAASV